MYVAKNRTLQLISWQGHRAKYKIFSRRARLRVLFSSLLHPSPGTVGAETGVRRKSAYHNVVGYRLLRPWGTTNCRKVICEGTHFFQVPF